MKAFFVALAFLFGHASQPTALAQMDEQTSDIEGSMVITITRLSPVHADSLVSCDGIVSDSTTHVPIAGANVVVRGTRKGVATNMNGAFHLDSLSLASSLVFHSVGLSSKSILVRSLSTLPSRPLEPIQMDSILAHLDLGSLELIRRALEKELASMQPHTVPDSTGHMNVLILDSLVQQSWLPEVLEGGFRIVSMQEIEQIARERRDVQFIRFVGIYPDPALTTIIVDHMEAGYRPSHQKMFFRIPVKHTYRFRYVHGEWQEGPVTTEIHDFAGPPDD